MNRGGTLGAYVSDLLLFLFGYSAWLWVVLLAQRVAAGFYRLTSLVLPNHKTETLPRVHWEAGVGFVLLFIGAMGIEALQLKHFGNQMPRSEESRVGKECVRRCNTRGYQYHKKKKNREYQNNIISR